MAILSTVAAALAYPTSSIYCKLVAAGLTILISLGIIPIGLYMRLINTMGLIVFVSLESVLILSGCIMYYFGNYFRYVAEVCWIFSISIIIFMIANQLKFDIKNRFSKFRITFDAVTIWMGMLTFYVITLICLNETRKLFN